MYISSCIKVLEYIAYSFILDSCSLQFSLLLYECSNGKGWDFNTAFMNYQNIKRKCVMVLIAKRYCIIVT